MQRTQLRLLPPPVPPVSVFMLEITHLRTGYVQIETYHDRFSRALIMIGLAAQPVSLRAVDY